MSVRIVKWLPQEEEPREITDFLKRPAFDEQAEEIARQVLAGIRIHGDKAVAEHAARFDGVSLQPQDFAVPKSDIKDARKAVSDEVRSAVREAHKRISKFAAAGMKKDWSIATPRGGTTGEQFVPLQRVGVYIPGGAAPLVSTVLMTVTLAKVAGVPEIVACTPCRKDGRVLPEMLYALDVAGATEVYRIGGIQAIGLMAYGTETVPKVEKIVGPGGAYVTAAKRQVYGHVALDLVAGPSEIAILADDTAVAGFVASDLLSQAEHGTGHEKALLITPSMKLAQAVQAELEKQAASLSRQESVRNVMDKGMLLVVVNNLTEGMDLCNRFAPEHLEIIVREPQKWPKKVKNAGAILIGTWTPESVGDYIAGPSHVLPTGGAAAMFSGLTVDDFRKRSSLISFTKADLQDVLPMIETFGRIEGFDAHAKSARIRFERG